MSMTPEPMRYGLEGMSGNRLVERLEAGPVICAEGYPFSWWEEAAIALDAILASGLPAVVTIAMHQEPVTRDGLTPEEACRRLEEAGATVVGLNCIRGPRTLMPMLRAVRAACGGHVAAL